MISGRARVRLFTSNRPFSALKADRKRTQELLIEQPLDVRVSGGVRGVSARAYALLLVAEAVAQTPGGLCEAVVRVGSEKPRAARHALPAPRDVGVLSRSHVCFHERAARFRGRLCATASPGTRSAATPLDAPLPPRPPQPSGMMGRDGPGIV